MLRNNLQKKKEKLIKKIKENIIKISVDVQT